MTVGHCSNFLYSSSLVKVALLSNHWKNSCKIVKSTQSVNFEEIDKKPVDKTVCFIILRRLSFDLWIFGHSITSHILLWAARKCLDITIKFVRPHFQLEKSEAWSKSHQKRKLAVLAGSELQTFLTGISKTWIAHFKTIKPNLLRLQTSFDKEVFVTKKLIWKLLDQWKINQLKCESIRRVFRRTEWQVCDNI